MANVTVDEFLGGETLEYRGPRGRVIEATYRTGDGIYLESKGKDLGRADVADDVGARRVYWNMIRRKK